MKLADFEKGWPILFGAFRDLAALTVGVWILLFKDHASSLLTTLAFLLLTSSAAGAARAFLRELGGSFGTSRDR